MRSAPMALRMDGADSGVDDSELWASLRKRLG